MDTKECYNCFEVLPEDDLYYHATEYYCWACWTREKERESERFLFDYDDFP